MTSAFTLYMVTSHTHILLLLVISSSYSVHTVVTNSLPIFSYVAQFKVQSLKFNGKAFAHACNYMHVDIMNKQL